MHLLTSISHLFHFHLYFHFRSLFPVTIQKYRLGVSSCFFFSFVHCFIMQSCSHHIKKKLVLSITHHQVYQCTTSAHDCDGNIKVRQPSNGDAKCWSLSFDSNCIVFPDFLSIIYTLDPYSSPHTAEEKVWSMRRHQSYCNG